MEDGKYSGIQRFKAFLEGRVEALKGNPNARMVLDVHRSTIAYLENKLKQDYEAR